MLFAGAFIALFGVLTIGYFGWVSLIIGGALVAGHYLGRAGGPTSVDESVTQIVAFAREAANIKLGISASQQEIPPIDVFGFLSPPVEGMTVQVKASGDGVRTSAVRVFIAYFGRDQMHIYTLTASLTEEGKFAEKTVEFFYSDVVSLSTETSPKATNLILSTMDGQKYESPVNDLANIDSEVNVARDLIRSKRV
jgi:hypothetical protein